MIDTPCQHWKWMLEEACYTIERGTRPLATVEVPTKNLDEARREIVGRELVCRADQAGLDLAGIESIEVSIAAYPWVLRLVELAESGIDAQDAEALWGLLLGYDETAIHEFLSGYRT